MTTSISIPVSVEVSAAEVLQGIFEINGILSFQADTVEFSYRTKTLIHQGGNVETIRIPLDKLQEVSFKSGLVVSKIRLVPRNLDVMDGMPGSESTVMVFRVKRAGKRNARQFVADLKNRLYALGQTGMDSVPFQLPDTNMGTTENSGLVYLDDEFLVFDLQSGLAGVTKNVSRTIKIEPAALVDVRFVQGRIKDALYIRPKKAELLEAMPGDHEVEVKLKIAKQHRRAAERLAGMIFHRIDIGSSVGDAND